MLWSGWEISPVGRDDRGFFCRNDGDVREIAALCYITHQAYDEIMTNKIFPVILVFFVFLTGCSGTMPNLGVNNGELTPCPETPNCVSSQAQDKEHFIEPIRFAGTQQQAHGNDSFSDQHEHRGQNQNDEHEQGQVSSVGYGP